MNDVLRELLSASTSLALDESFLIILRTNDVHRVRCYTRMYVHVLYLRLESVGSISFVRVL